MADPNDAMATAAATVLIAILVYSGNLLLIRIGTALAFGLAAVLLGIQLL